MTDLGDPGADSLPLPTCRVCLRGWICPEGPDVQRGALVLDIPSHTRVV